VTKCKFGQERRKNHEDIALPFEDETVFHHETPYLVEHDRVLLENSNALKTLDPQ
jgi:hypothetical protein